MGRAITIRTDLGTAADLRHMAKQQGGRRTALRLLAIANAMEGMSRAQAARSVGIERPGAVRRPQALQRRRDRRSRGPAKGHRRERLSEVEQAVLINRILRGPDPDRGEPCAWTLPDLCRFIEERFDKSMCPQSMSRVVRRLGLSRQKTRPVHPQKNPKAAAAFEKRGCLRPCRRPHVPTPTNALRCGSWMRPASGRKGGPRTAGG